MKSKFLRTLSLLVITGSVLFSTACETDEDQFPGGGRVTEVVIGVDNANFTGTCPHDFRFNGIMTTNGAGSITYFWERSTGDNTPNQTTPIPVPGRIVVINDLRLTASGSVTVRLRVVQPNQIDSSPLTVTAVCQ